jgi:hypothetical protein
MGRDYEVSMLTDDPTADYTETGLRSLVEIMLKGLRDKRETGVYRLRLSAFSLDPARGDL